MIIYSFIRENDGIEVEKFFPIGKCPDEIVCDDGAVAKRCFNPPSIQWKGGYIPPTASQKRKGDMTMQNKRSDRKMRERWQSVRAK